MMMLFICCLALCLSVSRCHNDLVMTVAAGQDVNLKCARQTSNVWKGNVFWTKVSFNGFPEVLAAVDAFSSPPVIKNPRVMILNHNGRFDLRLSSAQLNDTGIYICSEIWILEMVPLSRTVLRVKGLETNVTAVVQDLSLDRVDPEHSVKLRCSVFSSSRDTSCPREDTVFWFKSGSGSSHPTLLFTSKTRGDECRWNSTARSRTCVFELQRNFDYHDAGIYHCAVVSCGHVLFGDGSTVLEEGEPCQQTVQFLLGAGFALSLGVIAVLIYIIKVHKFEDGKAASSLVTDDSHPPQDNDAFLVYAAPNHSKRINGRRENHADLETKVIYSSVRVRE